MTPHLGQGATQAIEDAAALALFNDPEFDQYTVPEVLEKIESVRRKRASQIQTWTREYQAWKKTAMDPAYTRYCWTYPGIKTCLQRLEAGQEMIELPPKPVEVLAATASASPIAAATNGTPSNGIQAGAS